MRPSIEKWALRKKKVQKKSSCWFVFKAVLGLGIAVHMFYSYPLVHIATAKTVMTKQAACQLVQAGETVVGAPNKEAITSYCKSR